MPAFSGQFNWRPGLIWTAGFISGDVALENIRQGAMHVCDALVDTGASTTCISQDVVSALGLQPTGKAGMQTAGGSVDVNVFDIRMSFLFGGKEDRFGTVSRHGDLINDVIQAPEFDPGESSYKALIGRDFLRIGVLTLSFDGHYTFSY